MTAMAMDLYGRPFTRDSLGEVPDDGHRYEVVDGSLLVTPAPSRSHQRAAARLWRLLDDACPPDLEVIIAPFEVVLDDHTAVQPDVLVARRADLGERELQRPPLLVVEVVSPHTRRVDRMLKWSRYEAAGVPAYWVVEPDRPSVTAWVLGDGKYAEAGQARGEETFEGEAPFPVRVVPAQLVAER
ncbi:MAG: Uma2 family endonuclease [Streptomycetales bacterium]